MTLVERLGSDFPTISEVLWLQHFNKLGIGSPNCGGPVKIIAAIEDPPVIVKILSHLGLPTRAPPRSPAQRFDLFQTT